ncbi:MAG: hypothetical protein WCI31_08505 [Prolixibacteraceae bacterium]
MKPNRTDRKICATDGSEFRITRSNPMMSEQPKVLSVLFNVVAIKSKIGWYASPGKFSKEILPRKRELARVIRKS